MDPKEKDKLKKEQEQRDAEFNKDLEAWKKKFNITDEDIKDARKSKKKDADSPPKGEKTKAGKKNHENESKNKPKRESSPTKDSPKKNGRSKSGKSKKEQSPKKNKK